VSTIPQTSTSPDCVFCEGQVFNRKHQLCKTCSETIKKWAHRNGVTMSRAVAIRLSEGKPKMGRPQDDDPTATRKALTGRKTRLGSTHKSQSFGYVETAGPDRALAHVASNSRMGYLGGLHKDSTATVVHKAKQAKRESEPPRPLPTQKYGAVESVYERRLDWKDQGRHKYSAGEMLMGHVPDHCRRDPGRGIDIDGVRVRKIKRTYEVVEPLVVASQRPPEARYEGTRRLHALGWLPPSCERSEDESAVVLRELVPDLEDE
jgi:hypothetical protein